LRRDGDEWLILRVGALELETEINDTKKKHNAFLKELGLPLLP
jgi:hypothetical protein